MIFKTKTYLIVCVISIILLISFAFQKVNSSYLHKISGEKIDSLNGIYIYYNGSISNNHGRNVTKDGYNLGIKYQCVEFIKRYYYLHFHHKMPNSFGNAKDFFNPKLTDGKLNKDRNLIQFTNPSTSKPKVNDILIFNSHLFNKYGHVAIVSNVQNNEIEIIQQNPGPFSASREKIFIANSNGKWNIKHSRILGWLRLNE